MYSIRSWSLSLDDNGPPILGLAFYPCTETNLEKFVDDIVAEYHE